MGPSVAKEITMKYNKEMTKSRRNITDHSDITDQWNSTECG